MTKQHGKALSVLLTLVLVLALGAFVFATGVQGRVAARHKRISAADQRAIVALFKGVPKSKYRLKFNSGKTVAGSKRVAMRDMAQVSKITNPGEAAGYIVFIVEGNDVVYILAVGKDELDNAIGQERAAKLNSIMAKYAR